MQVKQLEYLLKIVECGSISQAASQLYISQPSLTKSIRGLEEEYGIQLLVRKSRGVELTVEGKNFVHYARGVLTAARALERNFISKQGQKRSRLFVAAQQLDFVYDLILQTYEENAGKGIHYNLAESDRDDVTRQVLSGAVDLGFLVRNINDAKNFLWYKEAKRLDIHVLEKAESYACVGPKSPYYDREEISFDEAKCSPNVVLDMESQAKENLYFDNQIAHFNTDQIVFFNTVSACERFLLQTDALLFVSKWTVGCFKNPKLHILSLQTEHAEHPEWNELLWLKRAGEPLNPTEQQFLCHVYEHFGKKKEEYPESIL